MKKYEAVVVLQPELQADALKIAIDEIVDKVKKFNSNIEIVEEWGLKPIFGKSTKSKEGFFCLIRFEAEPTQIAHIDREFSLNENVLKHMVTLKTESTQANTPQANTPAGN